MKIAIGSDHVGYSLKENLKEYLVRKGLALKDFGTHSTEKIDYPIVAQAVARAVMGGECEKGVLICGTGVGMAIGANKFKGIRAVVCSEPYTARASREHNDTNVLAMGSRVVGNELAKMVLDTWLETEFEGGRHEKRVCMLDEYE